MKLFPIMLEVEEPMLGTVLRLVKDMPGVAKLHLDLDGVAAKPKAKRVNTGPRLQPDPNRPKAKDIILRALMQGPKHLGEIKDLLGRHGYTDSNASANLTALRHDGIAEAGDGSGMHKLTDKFLKSMAKHQMNGAALPALPAPKKNETAKGKAGPKKARKSRSDGPSGVDIVLALCRKASPGAVARETIAAELNKSGFAERSIDGAVGKAKERGLIASSEKGFYEITEKGLKA